MSRFDAIVIGSGFGGSITTCRAAEKGMKVLLLERGRRWTPKEYPRKPGDAWLFSARRPARRNGWLDLRFFTNMTVAQAAGVGGGSLAYSSVALEAHPSLFTDGWPPEINFEELKPYYDTVAQVMNLQTVPDGQLTQRFKLAREAAEKLGQSDRFAKTPLAVTFSRSQARSTTWTAASTAIDSSSKMTDFQTCCSIRCAHVWRTGPEAALDERC